MASESKTLKVIGAIAGAVFAAILGAGFGAAATYYVTRLDREVQRMPHLSVPAKTKLEEGQTLLPLRNDSDWPVLVHEIRTRRATNAPAPCAAVPQENPVHIDPEPFHRGDWQSTLVRIAIEPGKTVDIPVRFVDPNAKHIEVIEIEVVYGELDALQLLAVGDFCVRPIKQKRDDDSQPPPDRPIPKPTPTPTPVPLNRKGWKQQWRYQKKQQNMRGDRDNPFYQFRRTSFQFV